MVHDQGGIFRFHFFFKNRPNGWQPAIIGANRATQPVTVGLRETDWQRLEKLRKRHDTLKVVRRFMQAQMRSTQMDVQRMPVPITWVTVASEWLLAERRGFAERHFRRADLIMTGLFNGRERTLDEYIELVESVEERLVFQKSFHPLGSITSIMEWVFVDPEHKNGQASIVPAPGTIPAKEAEEIVVVLEEQVFPTPPLTPDATVREKKSRARLSIGEDHPIPAFRAGPLFPDASLTSKLTSSREVLEIVDAV